MIDNNLLESSEFYNKRYGTFATKLIWPIVIGLILIVIFMCLTKKEIVVKAVGSIEPKKPLAIIQSSSNNPVKINNLHENKSVTKGDLLIQYDNSDIKSNQDLVAHKYKKNYAKTQALEIYKQSIITGQNLFNGTDDYGYADQYNDYLAQLADINTSTQQNNSDIRSSDNTQAKKNGDITRSNQSNTEKQKSLQAKTLADINQQLSDLSDQNDQLDAEQNNNDTQNQSQSIEAPKDGILHVENNNVKTKYLTSGSELAQIYPKLSIDTPLSATFYIPTDKLNGIQNGQKIRFRANQQGPKPLLLTGKIHQIDSAPTSTKQGDAYKVTANLKPTKKQYTKIRYGLTGNISVITGQKTWLNYVKDLLFTK
ncbi:HlyD family efflux transporter periplasmic adaptor subunit [Weissella minor]|uniref:Abpd bacteriocin export accessory protein n=1 Tax=Weissella minor TaxID=1620 RepID=A0A0R2JLR5_9LACO|nr:HlyD family efflux transporter periplasmic adaptor subunit [Weissella minor]KRN78113.1 abpd bacteriocin export accessory protein [Weissella minor]